MKKFLAMMILSMASPAFAQYSPTAPVSGASVIMRNSASSSTAVNWPGGVGVFSAVGTWNGATLTLEFIGPDGATLVVAGTGTTFTANGAGVFYLPECQVRAIVSSPGGSTSLTASISRVP